MVLYLKEAVIVPKVKTNTPHSGPPADLNVHETYLILKLMIMVEQRSIVRRNQRSDTFT